MLKKSLTLLTVVVAIIVVASCSSDGDAFKIEGRFKNINQSDFYIYSIEGPSATFDTIHIRDGRIAYRRQLSSPAILSIIFPNFSEQPVFAEPGKTVNIKGDVSHLREIQVKGTRDNELMNKWRSRLADSSPDECKQITQQFVDDNPNSRVGIYLIYKYLIQSVKPDYALAAELVKKLLKKQPHDGYLVRLDRMLAALSHINIGSQLPSSLKAMSLDSTAVDFAAIRKADVAVISTWASWEVNSMTQQRHLSSLARDARGRMTLLGISLDATKTEAKEAIKRDTLRWPTVCDELMFQSPLVDSLALTSVPDNIVLQRGKVVARSLPTDQLLEKVKELLKK